MVPDLVAAAVACQDRSGLQAAGIAAVQEDLAGTVVGLEVPGACQAEEKLLVEEPVVLVGEQERQMVLTGQTGWKVAPQELLAASVY